MITLHVVPVLQYHLVMIINISFAAYTVLHIYLTSEDGSCVEDIGNKFRAMSGYVTPQSVTI